MPSVNGSDVRKVTIACDAGMGSSVMVASTLRKKLKKYDVAVKEFRAAREFLVTEKFPSTKESIFVRKKQSSASSGRHTTGSFSLKEVFKTIGMPVRSRKNSISW